MHASGVLLASHSIATTGCRFSAFIYPGRFILNIFSAPIRVFFMLCILNCFIIHHRPRSTQFAQDDRASIERSAIEHIKCPRSPDPCERHLYGGRRTTPQCIQPNTRAEMRVLRCGRIVRARTQRGRLFLEWFWASAGSAPNPLYIASDKGRCTKWDVVRKRRRGAHGRRTVMRTGGEQRPSLYVIPNRSVEQCSSGAPRCTLVDVYIVYIHS